MGSVVHAVLDLDGYESSVARNPYLADLAARRSEGHYDTLATRRRRVWPQRWLFRPDLGNAMKLLRQLPWPGRVRVSDPGGVPDAVSRAEEVRVLAYLEGVSSPRRVVYGTDHPEAQFLDLYVLIAVLQTTEICLSLIRLPQKNKKTNGYNL